MNRDLSVAFFFAKKVGLPEKIWIPPKKMRPRDPTFFWLGRHISRKKCTEKSLFIVPLMINDCRIN